MTSVIDCRTHSVDLLAQKRSSPSRVVASVGCKSNLGTNAQRVKSRKSRTCHERRTSATSRMDLGILIGIALIVIWAIGALAFDAPGWIHLLLTVGVFVVIWRIVVRG